MWVYVNKETVFTVLLGFIDNDNMRRKHDMKLMAVTIYKLDWNFHKTSFWIKFVLIHFHLHNEWKGFDTLNMASNMTHCKCKTIDYKLNVSSMQQIIQNKYS